MENENPTNPQPNQANSVPVQPVQPETNVPKDPIPPPTPETQTQPTGMPNLPKKPKKLLFLLIALIVITLLGLVGYFAYQNYQLKQQIPQPQATPTSTPSKPSEISPTPVPSAQSTPTAQPVTIPSDWQQFTATDWDYGVKTTMSMPPGYSFRFTGSEFTIQNDSDATELWDYSTSVFKGWSLTCDKNTVKLEDVSECCSNDVINYYSGGSRRLWYGKLLNGDFSCIYPSSNAKMGSIVSVNENNAGNISYLEVIVDIKSSEKNEAHYIYIQNNILHIIKPVSHKATSTEALIPTHIGTIFVSLTSVQTK